MYELTYIVSPLAEGTNAAAAKVSAFINGQLAGQVKKEYIGEKKRLAYAISKQNAGTYVIVEFTAQEPEKMEELKKFLELDNNILRHLIIKTKEGAPAKKRAPRVKPAATALPAEETSAKAAKVGIEELDKKLEELLK